MTAAATAGALALTAAMILATPAGAKPVPAGPIVFWDVDPSTRTLRLTTQGRDQVTDLVAWLSPASANGDPHEAGYWQWPERRQQQARVHVGTFWMKTKLEPGQYRVDYNLVWHGQDYGFVERLDVLPDGHQRVQVDRRDSAGAGLRRVLERKQ